MDIFETLASDGWSNVTDRSVQCRLDTSQQLVATLCLGRRSQQTLAQKLWLVFPGEALEYMAQVSCCMESIRVW